MDQKLATFIILNSNFGGARRVTTENALTDLYIYHIGTTFIETINMAVA